ncbi:MAG: DUF3179 domain-containing protein [Micromonosporaceae bacterium]|nr:DUF3179 domain-containing protein [Micromonosporaceae bacterium]
MTPEDPPRRTRRQFLKGAAVLAGAAGLVGGAGMVGAGAFDSSRGTPNRSATAPPAESDAWLDLLAENTASGGPGKDGIPAIDKPRFVTAREMSGLEPDDPVFGLVHKGQARAYPQMVLVWHEIVNDRIGGEPISVTYCPLTGSAFGVEGEAGGKALTFGTTGQLVNSNLLMYDRQTDSEWPQIAGMAIKGRLRGQRLRTRQLVWSTWSRWRAAYPNTRVLSTKTGHVRQYGSDPYGSYTPPSGYYADDDVLFPVLGRDKRLKPKEVVLGVRAGGSTAAVVKEVMRKRRKVEFTLGGSSLAAVWDDKLATARVLVPGSDKVADFFDVMWFAWYAFYPDTKVIQ